MLEHRALDEIDALFDLASPVGVDVDDLYESKPPIVSKRYFGVTLDEIAVVLNLAPVDVAALYEQGPTPLLLMHYWHHIDEYYEQCAADEEGDWDRCDALYWRDLQRRRAMAQQRRAHEDLLRLICALVLAEWATVSVQPQAERSEVDVVNIAPVPPECPPLAALSPPARPRPCESVGGPLAA